MSQSVIIKNLAKTFGSKKVLHDINLEILAGESVAIIGTSGCGKSVLLKCISGLLIPNKGSSIVIDTQEFGNHHISKRTGFCDKLGLLFQGNALFDSMTIGENIVFGLKQKQELSDQKMRKIASEKLNAVDLKDNIIDLYPNQISGGMQKRVGLARAIAIEPDIILLDEPTSGLDPVTASVIIKLIAKLHKQMNVTVIMVSHDLHCVKTAAQKVAVIEQGTISWSGPVDQMAKSSSEFAKEFVMD